MFEGGWEVFGVGTIYPADGGPHIHYHASVGRAGHALTGCLREKATTYLIIEAVITEFIGLQGRREFDQRTQMNLPVLGSSQDSDSKGDSEESNLLQKGEKPTEEQAKDELPGGLAEIIRDLTQR